MTKLEKALCQGALKANRRYVTMNGYWLWHASEAYLTCTTAQHVFRATGNSVCIDFSPKRIEDEKTTKQRGRKPKDYRRRFDMVVWHKATKTVRAIVEVKRAYNSNMIKPDGKKLRRYAGRQGCAAYLLAYTHASGKNRVATLERRAKNWVKGIKGTLIRRHIDKRGDGQYSWSIYLIRVV